MSREIKFRAWHKAYLEMADVDSIDFSERRAEFDHALNYDHQEGGVWSDFISEIVLMQYTGLTDKSGTEIYEGDILEDNEYPEDGISHAVVVWDAEREGWNTDGWGERIESGAYEVIGNVWENPGLLENK